MIKQLIFRSHDLFLKGANALQNPTLFAMRVIWGGLFITEGWYKFSDVASNVTFYKNLGIIFPTFMVYLSGSAEFFCGILLVAGLLSRLATIPLIITMLVAAITDPSQAHFWGHGTGQTETFLAQIPLTFIYPCVIILVFGAGKWSLDHLLKKMLPFCR